jgi:hypothetical protein
VRCNRYKRWHHACIRARVYVETLRVPSYAINFRSSRKISARRNERRGKSHLKAQRAAAQLSVTAGQSLCPHDKGLSADIGEDDVPADDHVEFNALLAFSKLGDAVDIDEKELFAAMQQKRLGHSRRTLTSKALTGMNMNSRQDVLEGSDDESFDDNCEKEHYEEDDVDPVGLHHADLLNAAPPLQNCRPQ